MARALPRQPDTAQEAETLTITRAAYLLNVPRGYLMQLLDEGEMPSTGRGERRRLRRDDILAYKRKRDAIRRAALRELTQLSQEAGLGDIPFSALKTDAS